MAVIYSLEGVRCESGGGGEGTILAWVQLSLLVTFAYRQFISPARRGEQHLMIMTWVARFCEVTGFHTVSTKWP